MTVEQVGRKWQCATETKAQAPAVVCGLGVVAVLRRRVQWCEASLLDSTTFTEGNSCHQLHRQNQTFTWEFQNSLCKGIMHIECFPRISLHSSQMHHWLAKLIIRSTFADQPLPEEGSPCGTTSVASANACPVRNSFSPHNYHNSWVLSLSLSVFLQHISSRAPNVLRESVGEKNPPKLKWIHTDSWWKKYENHVFPKTRTQFLTSFTNP